MAAETSYEVNAYLRLKGDFERKMKQASRSIDPVQRKLERLSRTAERFSRKIRGGPVPGAGVARTGALAAGAASAAGLGAMLMAGFRFNRVMADAKMSIGTMFQMFDVGQAYVKQGADKGALFNKNMELAEHTLKRILVLQQETPAGATQLIEMYQQGISGFAQGSKDIERQLALLTKMSMLGPALNNDYGQIGRDIMRILGGGAEQEVLTWRLLRGEVFKLVEGQELLGKNIQNNDQFVQKFNKDLSAATKMKLLEDVMGKLGPEFKKMFSESMSGLAAASKSKMAQIAASFTGPLYLGWREFLKRANMDEGGLLSVESLNKFIGIAAYFGDVVGKRFTAFLKGFENVMGKMRDNWSSITDELSLAFGTGATLLKLYIAQALGRAAAAKVVSATGGAVGTFNKVRGAIGGVMGGDAFRSERMRRRADAHMRGSPIGKIRNLIITISSLGTVLLPTIVAFAALAAAAAVVGVIVAGMAAYIIQNWKVLIKQLLAGWGRVSGAMTSVYLMALNLWKSLVIVGEAFLGGSGAVDLATFSLGMLEDAIWGIAKGIQAVLTVMSAWNVGIAVLQDIIGMTIEGWGKLARVMGMGTALEDMGRDMQDSAAENRQDALAYDRASAQIDAQLMRGLTDREAGQSKKVIDELKSKLEAMLKGGVKKTPGSGVTVQNMYNQWDLRNTDPDRLMSAFIPKLEALADQRTQAYDALDQGV